MQTTWRKPSREMINYQQDTECSGKPRNPARRFQRMGTFIMNTFFKEVDLKLSVLKKMAYRKSLLGF